MSHPPHEQLTSDDARLLLVVADGVRPDMLCEALDSGRAPALQSLRERGSMHAVTSSFPSVTGPAYVPFLMGQHPAQVGVPGLRWFDRSRRLRGARGGARGSGRGSARSYAGLDIWHLDHDIAVNAPTLFELARPSLSGLSMLARGSSVANIGRSLLWSARGAVAHFRGDSAGWRRVEQAATAAFLRHFAQSRPRFATLAITSADKFAHKYGCDSAPVREAIGDIDAAVARALAIAREGGWSRSLRVWVVGDHGHAPVSQHDDVHAWLESRSLSVHTHPRLRSLRADVALMVGGNAMAHLYLEPGDRERRWWPSLHGRWSSLHDALLARPSVDLVAVAMGENCVRVSHAARGDAFIRRRVDNDRMTWDYDATTGDPLCLGGSHAGLDDEAAWDVCAESPYPDAIVQLFLLGTASSSGDLLLSAADDWDLRARYEPVSHVSTHGALSREQMLVPLLLDSPIGGVPRRTADVMPSALDALGLPIPSRLHGRSFWAAP